MAVLDELGDPIRCDGCGSEVDEVTEAMHRQMPVDLSRLLHQSEDVEYLVCGPGPDGIQPCLRRAITLDAIRVARLRAPDGGFPAPIVIAGVPKMLTGWWTAAGDPPYRPGIGHVLIGCENPQCGEEIWLGPRAQILAEISHGCCVLLCLACAVVEQEYRTEGGVRWVDLSWAGR